MLAAEATFGALNEGLDMDTYWDTLKNSWIWEELHKSRNYRPVSEAIHFHFYIYFYFFLLSRPYILVEGYVQFSFSGDFLSFGNLELIG